MLGAVGGATVNMHFHESFSARRPRPFRHQKAGAPIRRRASCAGSTRHTRRARAVKHEVRSLGHGRKAGALHGAAVPATIAAAGCATIDPRRAGCGGCGSIATLLLVLMAAVFVVTTAVKLDWPWIPYLRAFAEAGMVGACADWFAIVALFRRPLGLPIPHTGIVPDNKERIGKALGTFHHQQFPHRRGDERKAGAHRRRRRGRRNGSQSRPMPSGSATISRCNCRGFPGRLPVPQIGESIGRLALQARGSDPGRAVGVKAAGDHLGARRSAGAGGAALSTTAKTWLSSNKDLLTRQNIRSNRRAGSRNGSIRMIAEKVHQRHARHARRNARRRPSLAGRAAQDGRAADRGPCRRPADARARRKPSRPSLLANPLVIEQAKTLWAEVETGLTAGSAGACGCHRARLRAGAAQHRRVAAGRRETQGTAQPAHSGHQPALFAALSGRDRRLYRAGGAQLGHRDAWSTGWNCKSARTCNISASTARWSAGSSAC